MSQLDYATALALVGEDVTVKDANSGLQLIAKVTEVNTLALNGEEWESFAIILQYSADMVLGQSTYDVEHERIGVMPIFISPNSDVEAEVIVTRRLTETA